MISREPGYQRQYELMGRVSNTIVARRIPNPSDIYNVLGERALFQYYFMHALFHRLEHGKGIALVNPVRTDEKALQRHPFDAAVRPSFRADDATPSNFSVTPRETNGILLHDLGEDFGRSVLGAFVVNDMIRYLFGRAAGKDTSTLTNYYALAMRPAYDRIREEGRIDQRSIMEILAAEKRKIHYIEGDITREARRVVRALQNFMDFTMPQPIDKCPYMPQEKREELTEIMAELSSRSLSYLNERGISAASASQFAHGRYRDLMQLVREGRYVHADVDMLLPDENPSLVTLEKTLYWHFMRDIYTAARKEAAAFARKRTAAGDGYLSPFIEKIAEAVDNAANMEYTPPSKATSIHRKTRIVIATGADLAEYLGQRGTDYTRLQNADYYLFRILRESIWSNIESLRRKAGRLDTSWRADLERFERMLEKTNDLEARLRETEQNGDNIPEHREPVPA